MSKPPQEPTMQLPLDLPLEASARREDLIESPANSNRCRYDRCMAGLAGQSGRSGPVRLARANRTCPSVWISAAGGTVCPMTNLTDHLEELQNCLQSGGNVLLEDAGAGFIDEDCTVSSSEFCTGSWMPLPDYITVLAAGMERAIAGSSFTIARSEQVVELLEPDDLLLKQVMVKLLADRQLMVDEKIYRTTALLRMERSLETAARLVAEVDAEALSRKTPISRSIAAQVLARMGME